MRLNITARHFKLSDPLKEFIEKEVRRLKKYYDGIIDAEVIVDAEKKFRMIEIKINVYGTILTAHQSAEEIQIGVRETVDKLERQLIKYKNKLRGFEREKGVDIAVSSMKTETPGGPSS